MVKIIKNTHWSVYAFALSVLMATYSIISIGTLVEVDIYYLLMHMYLIGFFGFIAFLTKPIFPPKHKSIEEQQEYVNEKVGEKYGLWEESSGAFYFLMLGSVCLVMGYFS